MGFIRRRGEAELVRGNVEVIPGQFDSQPIGFLLGSLAVGQVDECQRGHVMDGLLIAVVPVRRAVTAVTAMLEAICTDIYSAPWLASAWAISWPMTCAISSSVAASLSISPL